MTRAKGWLGAALLGLPAAILAHAFCFGGSHVVGGLHHAEVVDGALLLAIVAASALAFAALFQSRCVTSGSVLARRLESYIPAWPALAVGTGAWLGIIERLETPHVALPVSVLLAIALAVVAMRAATRTFARALAAIVIEVLGAGRIFADAHPYAFAVVGETPLALGQLCHPLHSPRAPPRA